MSNKIKRAVKLKVNSDKHRTPSVDWTEDPNTPEPQTPNTQLFESNHSVFDLPSHNVIDTWNVVKNRVKKSRSRALSVNVVNPAIINFGSLLNELIRGKRKADQKEEDLKLAAEIGQTLLEKNTHVESVCVDLRAENDVLLTRISRLQKQCQSYKQHAEDLTDTNMKLVKLTEAQDEIDFDKFSLPDFLRSELETDSLHFEYVGDVNKDMVSFRRKLRKERRQAQLAQGLYEESLATLKEEKNELRLQIDQMRSSLQERDSLEAKNAKLQQELMKLHDKMRDQNLQNLALMNRKKASEDDLLARENKLQEQHRRELDQLEIQLMKARQRIETLEKENKNLKEARAAGSAAEMKQLVDENKLLNQKIKNYMNEIKNQKNEIDDLQKKLSAFREVAMNLRGETERERELTAVAEKKAKEYQVISQSLETKIDDLAEKVLQAERDRNSGKNQEEIDEANARLDVLKNEKNALEVQLLINQKRERAQLDELKKREEELKLLKHRMLEYEREREELKEQFKSVEIAENIKFQEHNSAISRITQQLRVIMREYLKKKEESQLLQRQLNELKEATQSLESLQAAKAKYKEMGKKMLDAMKQMDSEMKELVDKLNNAEKALKESEKERKRLQRKTEELQDEIDRTDKQMNKLMRLCIRGNVKQT